MKQTSTLTKMLLTLAAMLLSLPASAQLSLSAGASASADNDGAEATSDGNADGAADAAPADAGEAEAAPPPPPPPAPVMVEEVAPAEEGDTGGTAGYDKGFYIKSNDGNFKLVIHGMAKTRWNVLNDSYAVYDGAGELGTNHSLRSNFSMNYARVLLSGHMFTPKLGYTLYFNFVNASPVYAFASYKFIPEKLMIKVGLFKRPISRAYLISSVKRQFIDGPLGQMGGGIDLGIELSNDYSKVKGLEWAIGIFNDGGSGTGPANGTNPVAGGNNIYDNNGALSSIGGDFAPALVGRIGYNNGIKGYSNVDFEGGPVRFGVAFSASTELDHDDDDRTEHYLSVDGMLKVQGLALSTALYLQAISEDGFWDPQANSAPAGNSGLQDIGAFLQGGYLIKGMFEPMARFGMRHNYNVDKDLRLAFTQGFGIYFFKSHSLKWENNITQYIRVYNDGVLNNDAEVFADILFSSQLQFFF